MKGDIGFSLSCIIIHDFKHKNQNWIMKLKYYVKKIYYGNRVKVVFLPLDLITKSKNVLGVKNLGKNTKKLRHNNVRAKTNFVAKAFHNFYNADKLSMITLTFKKNEMDLKVANKKFNQFTQYLSKRHVDLKWSVSPETQKCGAWHFHMLATDYFDQEEIRRWWDKKYNLGKFCNVRRCFKKNGFYIAVTKYCSKYVTKTVTNGKSVIQSKLNHKMYRFSYNCENPVVETENVEWNYLDMFSNSLSGSDYSKPFYSSDKKVIGYVCDYSLENWENKVMKGRLIK